MENSIKITLIILIGVFLLALLGIGVYFRANPSDTLKSSGVAEVKVVPDILSVYFSVETNGSTAKEAKDENSEIIDGVITELVKLGLERKEINTESFNVYPDYSWEDGERIEKGYKASHRLKVSLENQDKIGDVIDAGVDAGAGISYINFELSQGLQNTNKREALRLATLDAKSKAEGIASGLDNKVGRVVSVSSQDFYYNPWRLYESTVGASKKDAKQAVIQPGERTVQGRVEVVYKLK